MTPDPPSGSTFAPALSPTQQWPLLACWYFLLLSYFRLTRLATASPMSDVHPSPSLVEQQAPTAVHPVSFSSGNMYTTRQVESPFTAAHAPVPSGSKITESIAGEPWDARYSASLVTPGISPTTPSASTSQQPTFETRITGPEPLVDSEALPPTYQAQWKSSGKPPFAYLGLLNENKRKQT